MKRLIAGMMVMGMIMGVSDRKRHVIYAQSVPYTATVSWDQNTVDNVTQYTITLDTGTPVVVQTTVCAAGRCSSPLSIPSFGSHTWFVFASNCVITNGGSPCTVQNGPASSEAFSLNKAPGSLTNQRVQ